MGFVIIGRQGGREQPAGAVADVAEKKRFGAPAFPVADHADPSAVGEAEGGDVDGIGRGMLAPGAFGPAVDPAAAVASIMLDRGDLRAEVAERGGLDDMPFPERKPRGDRTAGAEVGRSIADGQRSAGGEADGVVVAALPVAARRQSDEADSRAAKEGVAGLAFSPQSRELAAGEGADRPGHVELRPGQILGMAARVAPAEKGQKGEQSQH